MKCLQSFGIWHSIQYLCTSRTRWSILSIPPPKKKKKKNEESEARELGVVILIISWELQHRSQRRSRIVSSYCVMDYWALSAEQYTECSSERGGVGLRSSKLDPVKFSIVITPCIYHAQCICLNGDCGVLSSISPHHIHIPEVILSRSYVLLSTNATLHPTSISRR